MSKFLGLNGKSRHVDPSKFSFEELANIRGSMWNAKWADARYGPRRGRPDNVLAMDFYEYYPPDERKEMLKIYKDHNYTHAVTGPMVDLGGYHGLYPITDIRQSGQSFWDFYLDCMQEWWDNGIIPIHFIHPDGWGRDDMEVLVPFYLQPRAQRLLRVKVWTGWEPTRYDWSAREWQLMLGRGNEVMPEALSCVHTVNDCDALTGNGDDHNLPGGNAEAWAINVNELHVWLDQTAGSYNPISDIRDPDWQPQYDEFKVNFADRYRDLNRRFGQGYAGWPTYSRWGSNQPLRPVAAEYVAYPTFWDNWPEAIGLELGGIAKGAGAYGALDGVD